MSVQFKTSAPIMVTGANGYIASWLVKMLLEAGNTVHATVRNPEDKQKVGHLEEIAANSAGTLTFFKADLLDAAAFDAPMQGCEIVIHTASPFVARNIKAAENQLLKPAKQGTLHVLEAANRVESVKRVVLTSSVVGVYGDAIDMTTAGKSAFTEADWNFSSSATHQPYNYSKRIAEELAWEVHDKQDRWKLLTINPGVVFGPALGTTQSESVHMMRDFGNGMLLLGAPDMELGMVDVRDVAKAHILAAFTPEASGRHLTVSDSITYMDISRIFQKHFGKRYPFPRFAAPKFVLWLIAPLMGITRKFVTTNVGYPLKFDTSYIKSDLGMEFIDPAKTVTDHFQQLLDDGIIKKRG
jgi:nucleoside-diphosphate-sugar epimerase